MLTIENDCYFQPCINEFRQHAERSDPGGDEDNKITKIKLSNINTVCYYVNNRK